MKKQFILIISCLLLFSCQTLDINTDYAPFVPIELSGDLNSRNIDDFKSYLEKNMDIIISKYNPAFHKKVNVILFSSVEDLHKVQGRDSAPNWSVGQSRSNGDIWMVNPYNSEVHDYEAMKKILVHEYSHCIVNSINRNVPTWLNEGIACFEADQHKSTREVRTIKDQAQYLTMPKYWEIDKDHNSGDVYKYSRSIVEYIINEYSLEKLVQFIKNPNVVKVFGINKAEFQENWKNYIIEKY